MPEGIASIATQHLLADEPSPPSLAVFMKPNHFVAGQNSFTAGDPG